MASVLGKDCKLYRNTATWASPSWDEVTNCRDLTLSLEKGDADASTRAADWRRHKVTLIDGRVEFEMVWDNTDTDFIAFKDAFFNGTTIECAVLDGAIDEAGNTGLRSDFEVMSFTRSEALEDVATVSVSLVPAYTDNTPAWYTSTT